MWFLMFMSSSRYAGGPRGLFRAAGPVNSSLAGMGPSGRSTLRLSLCSNVSIPTIYDAPGCCGRSPAPRAFSVERDAAGFHTDMMPTIGPQILNSDGALVGQIGTKAG